jgi:hypothetical protein
MSRRALAMLASSLALSGCYFSGRSAVLAGWTEEGRAVAAVLDPAEAYVVWHDPAGWHLRVRSNVARRFEGVVVAAGANGVTAVGVEPAAVRAAGSGFAFDLVADAGAGEVGFDWRGGCAEFSLYVEGETRPLRVFAGPLGANPSHIPFSLCPYRFPPPG